MSLPGWECRMMADADGGWTLVFASSAVVAVERFVRDYDAYECDYEIARGAFVIAKVRALGDAAEFTYSVTGQMAARYSAHEVGK